MRLPCITPIKSSHFERCERLLRSVNVLTSNEVNAYFERSKTTLLKSFIEHQLMRAKARKLHSPKCTMNTW